DLLTELRLEVDGIRFLLCHGSPRQTNEFLWDSTTSTHFLDKLALNHNADVVLATHTGIHWQRELSEGRRFVNVGVLGRPENDGSTNVWYTIIRTGNDLPKPTGSAPWDSTVNNTPIQIEFIPLAYNHERLAQEMQDEGPPRSSSTQSAPAGGQPASKSSRPASAAPANGNQSPRAAPRGTNVNNQIFNSSHACSHSTSFQRLRHRRG
ncbi:MAG: hypothetical protein HON53_00325, partial [Planctomycetaceae bacterium]|nr:hypothetical protein [Planctomycetaceae bacterium]